MLIIGGGDGGCLREALKHPGVERVTQVEIDAGVIELCRRWLPSISDGAFDHPKARVVIADGARFAAESPDRFDVVIVDSTDPQGPGAVLFTSRVLPRRPPPAPGPAGSWSPSAATLDPARRAGRDAGGAAAAGFALVDYYLPVVPTYIGGAMALGFATDEPARRRTADQLRARGVPPACATTRPRSTSPPSPIRPG